MSEPVLQAIDPHGVATLTLNRPERHNALDGATIARLAEALRALGADPAVRVVVLAGNGPSFCAGADLGWMRRMAEASFDDNLADADALAGLIETLDRLAKPTLALVHGSAYGGGVGLLACCDVALAAETATFRLSEVRLGLTPATIGPAVVRAIGARQARRWMLTAEPIPAARAREIGLVHEVAPAGALGDAARAIVAALLEGAPEAQGEAKDLVFLCEASLATRAETGRRIAARRASAEGREGVSAFLARRPPAWHAG